jgi:hypothetical protein
MEGNDVINLPDVIAKMGESLVDLILSKWPVSMDGLDGLHGLSMAA